MKVTSITRLLELIVQLQAGPGQNGSALARRCLVSRRTIFRDLDVLRRAGVPLQFNEQTQSYRIQGEFLLPPTNFTPQEALALLVLCHELGDARHGMPFQGTARTAAVKLEASLPGKLHDHVRQVADAVHIRVGPSTPLNDSEPLYEQLLDAIRGRRCVRISYQSLTEWETISTRLSPYRLLFSRRSWYVVGRSSLHRSTRTFHVGRIRQLEKLDERFSIPRGFSIDRVLRNAWHMIPEPGPDRHVVIRFEPMVAQNVAEVVWHKTQRLEWQEDGRLLLHACVSGLKEISWWVLGYGHQAEVIDPPELRDIVAEHARRLVERYRDREVRPGAPHSPRQTSKAKSTET